MGKTFTDQVSAMRARNRAGLVAALQEGRKQRASVLQSGKRYKRRDGKRVDW